MREQWAIGLTLDATLMVAALLLARGWMRRRRYRKNGAPIERRLGDLVCSFCGKSQEQVGHLIAGPTVFICDNCTILCLQILGEQGSLNLRAGYFAFEFVAKLLWPISRLFSKEKSTTEA